MSARRKFASALVVVAVVASLTTAAPALAAENLGAPPVQREKSVPGTVVRPRTPAALPRLAELSGDRAVVRPAARVSTVDVGQAAGAIRLAGSDAGPLRVETLRSRPTELLFQVSRPTPGKAKASLDIDYSSFRHAYGGDWAARLRLRALPTCALTTPGLAECRGTDVPARNDVAAGRISADVSVGASGAMFSLMAGPSGNAGSFAATGLSPSSTWSAGGSGGEFGWGYPLRVPAGLGGPTPSVNLSYSSSAVDGRTMATNNQPSWVGEGFEFWPGFVERRYKPCVDDGQANVGDLCWETDNATMSLNGSSTELIKDDATGAWKPRNDDGSRVEHLFDTGLGNGDDNGEYWRITTTDGTQYWFGRNRLPGYTAGKPETGSTWTAPVFGNEVGEPCHTSTFDGSYCAQAWRWNLDYVVDVHGNSMSYWYAKETNFYGRQADKNKATEYVRGGTLTRIDYGTRQGSEYASNPTARVVFGSADRCLPNSTCDFTHPENWTDTPLDQRCAGAPCQDIYSPTFWTQKRLASVTTQVWNGTAMRNVESWTLRHTYPDPGDGTRPGLWLAGITHTGLTGGSAALPEVTFGYVQLDNRVVTNDGRPPMKWLRIGSIENEAGGDTRITYSAKDCVFGSRMPASTDGNTLRCQPVKGTYPDQDDKIDWFHKYVVTEVTENDYVGGTPQVRSSYEYVGTPAWHYDDADGLVDEKFKTWGQWRGYEKVRTTRGVVPDVRTYSEALFFRGMDGDKLASGGTRSVQVRDSQGGLFTDHESYAGMLREQIVFAGVAGVEVTATLTDPTQQQTGTAAHPWGTVRSFRANEGNVQSRTTKAGGGGQHMRVEKTFDAQGLPTRVYDHGDIDVPGDEQCTTFTYARDTAQWLLTPTSRVETYALPCGTAPTSESQVLSDTRIWYDNAANWNAAPTKGDATKIEEIKTWSPTGSTYTTAARNGFDTYGRVVESWDALDERSTTAYEPASGGPLTAYVTTNPLGHQIRTELDPGYGQPTKTVDPNNRTTELTYDPLGRLTSAWLPGRAKGTFPSTPDIQHTYLMRGRTGPAAVTTKSLRPDNGYNSTIELYDGLLRPRQTQLPGPNGGRLLADWLYNSLGQSHKQNGAYWNAAPPVTDLLGVLDANVPGQNRSSYDGAGRVVAQGLYAFGVERWTSRTSYVGANRIDVTPLLGGTATTAITDAQGRTTEYRQYHGTTPTGTYDATLYTYTPGGQVASVTDSAGNVWRHTYDLRGREILSEDPDKGDTTTEWNDANQVTAVIDARGQQVTTTYDRLGRATAQFEVNGATQTQVAATTYDSVALGLPTSSTRFVDGNAYVSAITGYDARYQPSGMTLTIPPSEGGLAGTYTMGATYNADGSLATLSLPSMGGLAAETLTYGYDQYGNATTLTGAANYVTGASYTDLSELGQVVFGSTGKRLWQTYTYEIGTRRLVNVQTKREAAGAVQADVAYQYDATGNVIRIVDTPNATTGVPKDTQCFSYDNLRRLTKAWTPTSHDCAAAPTKTTLGGPAPYWHAFTYDKTGNRLTDTRYGVGAGTADALREYSYPAAGQDQPHTVRSVRITDSGGARTLDFGYDPSGNTTTRPGITGVAQTLTWDGQGRLTKLVESGNTSEFRYDASGNRIIRKDPDGSLTLTFAGQELKVKGATRTATRYYSFGGSTIGVRTNDNKLTWLCADRMGTAQLAVDAATLGVSRRRFTAFGEPRGSATAWPGEKGYVGGTTDPTGLTHLGARDYDPISGRFLSADPVIDIADPQQMHGYAYANNSPVTYSDPSGLMFFADSGGGGGSGKSKGGGSTTTTSSAPGPTDDEIAQAKEIEKQDLMDVAIKAGGDLLMEFLGINDIRDCFTKGDVMACVSMVAGFIPWTKVVKIPKIAKALKRAYDAYVEFKKKIAWAKDILTRAAKKADEAAETVTDGATKVADDAAAAGTKKGDEAADAAADKADDVKDAAADSCPVKNSFVPGTLVLLADGTHKPIEAVQVGDRVATSGDAQPVTATITGDGAKTLVEVTVEGGGTLTATNGHPFWVESRATWVDAGNLKSGDVLLTPDGSRVRVLAVAAYGAQAAVHNLTVATDHTYYVSAGDTDVLVHNCGNPDHDAAHAAVAANPKKVIIIGESMPRVRAAAAHFGAWAYRPAKDNYDAAGNMLSFPLAMARNKRWIKDKMREGYTIISIGLDPKRDPKKRSPFFAMELDETAHYPVIEVPWP